MKGRIPLGSWVFIAGEPGTGKTIMCLHIAYANLKEGIDVIYVTTEQPFRDLIDQAAQFKSNLHEYVSGKDRLLHVIDMFKLCRHAWELKKEGTAKILDPLSPDHLVTYIRDLCNENKIENPLIVIDSLSAFWVDKPAMARRITYRMKLRGPVWH